MAHPPETRAALRAAYIGGLPLDLAAEQAEVPVATARRWIADGRKAGDDWDKFRAASLVVAGGGIEQALGRVIAAGLMRCETLLERTEHAEDPFEAVRAMAVLGDTVSKLKSAAKGMMPEADRLAVETAAIKGFVDLMLRLHPGVADAAMAALESYASGRR